MKKATVEHRNIVMYITKHNYCDNSVRDEARFDRFCDRVNTLDEDFEASSGTKHQHINTNAYILAGALLRRTEDRTDYDIRSGGSRILF